MEEELEPQDTKTETVSSPPEHSSPQQETLYNNGQLFCNSEIMRAECDSVVYGVNCVVTVLISCLLTAEEADLGFSASCLTTAELQQHWRAIKQEFRSVKLLFDIPNSRIINQTMSKYVVHQRL